MSKVKFEYEIDLPDEIQEKYSELSEACVLPIISDYLITACRGMDRDIGRIINGFHSVYALRGKEGLKEMSGHVNSMVQASHVVMTREGEEAEKKIQELLS